MLLSDTKAFKQEIDWGKAGLRWTGQITACVALQYVCTYWERKVFRLAPSGFMVTPASVAGDVINMCQDVVTAESFPETKSFRRREAGAVEEAKSLC